MIYFKRCSGERQRARAKSKHTMVKHTGMRVWFNASCVQSKYARLPSPKISSTPIKGRLSSPLPNEVLIKRTIHRNNAYRVVPAYGGCTKQQHHGIQSKKVQRTKTTTLGPPLLIGVPIIKVTTFFCRALHYCRTGIALCPTHRLES